jgi:hypothetical protein
MLAYGCGREGTEHDRRTAADDQPAAANSVNRQTVTRSCAPWRGLRLALTAAVVDAVHILRCDGRPRVATRRVTAMVRRPLRLTWHVFWEV